MVVSYNRAVSRKYLGHLLSFSYGVMLFISFMDLLPGAVLEIGYFSANIWVGTLGTSSSVLCWNGVLLGGGTVRARARL